MALFDRVVNPSLLVRRLTVTAAQVIRERDVKSEPCYEQMDMFTDYEALEREQQEIRAAEEKERKLQRVTLAMQDKFGKNAILKGMNLVEGGTTIERNGQIGGHKAGDD